MSVKGAEVIILSENVEELSEIDLNKMIEEITKETKVIIDQYKAEISRINAEVEAGNMTPEEAEEAQEAARETMEENLEAFEERWEEWGDSKEAKWDAWGEAYGKQWEDWAEQWEAEAEKWEAEKEAGKDVGSAPQMPPMPNLPPTPPASIDEKIIIKTVKKEKKRKRQRTKGTFDLHLGLSQMVEAGGLIISDQPAEQQTWKSANFELGLGGKTRMFGDQSKFYLKYGLAVNWNWFSLKGKNAIFKDTATGMAAFGENGTSLNVASSKFSVGYLDIPLMLQFDSSTRGMDNGFTLGVGGYGGVKLYSKRTIDYDDEFNDRSTQYTYNSYFMPSFRYGLIGQIGYGHFKATAKYDLNSMFKDNKGPDYHIASITLGFSW